MNSKERVYARMEGRKVDRLPNMPIVMQFASRVVNKPYSVLLNDYRQFTDAMLLTAEKFNYDCLWLISDPMRETEGFGARIIMPEDGVPYSPVPLIEDYDQVKDLKVIDPSMGRRMNDRVEGARRFREIAGDDYPIVGWVEGAFAEACDLRDLNEVLCDLYEYEDELKELLEKTLEQGQKFAIAQIEAGADIIGIGDAAASLIGPEHYRKFALPYEQRLIQTIKEHGAKAKLHICGNLNPILDLVCTTGTDILDLDHMVDIDRCAQIIDDNGYHISLSGNFDPVDVMLRGTTQVVNDEVIRCANIDTKWNIISAGCEVPKDTPYENMTQIYRTICSIGER